MNTKLTTVLSGLLLGMAGIVNAQSWSTAYQEGTGASMCKPLSMSFGAPSTSFVAGQYANNPVFGSTTLSNAGGSDAFLVRMNSAGVSWAVRAGGANADAFKKVYFCGGAAIVYGTYSGSITFYGTNATTSTLNNGTAFLAKYSSNGVIEWAVNFTGTVEDFAHASGYVYTIGDASVLNSVVAIKSFDLTTGAAGPINLTSTSGTFSVGKGIGADNSGNLYFLAQASSNFKLSGSPTYVVVGNDLIFGKLNATTGAHLWSTQLGNIGNVSMNAKDMEVSSIGDIYITGYYNGGVAYMEPSSATTHTFSSTGVASMFVAKYDNLGAIAWSKNIQGTNATIPLAMDYGTSSLYLAVHNTAPGTVTFTAPACPVTYSYTSSTGGKDNKWFIIKYLSSTGDIDWSAAPESYRSDVLPVGIGAWSQNAAVVAGPLNGQMDFGSHSVNEIEAVYYGRTTEIICKPGVAAGIEEYRADDLFKVYPNPGTGVFTIDAEDFVGGQIDVYEISGKKVQSLELDGSITSKTINLTGYSKGIYLMNLSFEGKNYSKKLILE